MAKPTKYTPQGFMPTQDVLRGVDFYWDADWLWDCAFLGGNGSKPPAPFDKWFPAVNITAGRWSLNSRGMDGPMIPVTIPESSNPLRISLEYIDAEDLRLTRWFEKWVRQEILNYNKHITLLKESTKQFDYIKLNHQRQIVEHKSYLVYPDGESSVTGGSQGSGSSPIYSVDLIVAAH